MSKTRKRQSLAGQRLKKEFPDIHAQLAAGHIPSLKKALAKAGIEKKPTPVEKLLKAWGKANAQERDRFLAKIGASRTSAAGQIISNNVDKPLIANGRYLLPQTIKRIETVMKERKLSPAKVMDEAGFASEGRSLTRALAQNASLRLAVVAAIEDWLIRQQKPAQVSSQTSPTSFSSTD